MAALFSAAALAAAAFFILHPFVLGRRNAALAAGVAGLAAFILLLPVSDRLEEEGFSSLRRYRRLLQERRADRAKAEIRRAAVSRFTDEVPASAGDWRDPALGLVWGPPLDLELRYDLDSWKRAAEACAGLEPRGAWSLPSMAEWQQARKAGLVYHGRWLATVYLLDQGLTTMGLVSGPGRGNEGGGPEAVRARCVGRTAQAPPQGKLEMTNAEALEGLR